MEDKQRRVRQESRTTHSERTNKRRTPHRSQPRSPVSDIQQWIGNTALKQLFTSPSFSAAQFVKQNGHYTAMPQLLALLTHVYSEEDSHQFSAKFETLTTGQQQAFWLDLIANSSLAGSIDIKQWLRDMEKLRQVDLQPDEPLHEGDIKQLGAYEPPYASSYQGLLSPYRALWQWLNYKGNKQGQRHLLLRLDSLSLPAKQLLLHRLIKRSVLSTSALSAALTIERHEQEWVDWSRIEKQLEQLHSLSQERIKQQLELVQQSSDTAVNEAQALEDDELEVEQLDDEALHENGEPWLAGLLANSLSDSGDQQQAQAEYFAALYDPEQLCQLLLGTSLASKQQAVPVRGDKLIDRLLRLEHAAPEKLAHLREKRSKQLGFNTTKALLSFIIARIIEQFEQQARERKDARYISLLQRMQLGTDGTLPGKQHLQQALQKRLGSV